MRLISNFLSQKKLSLIVVPAVIWVFVSEQRKNVTQSYVPQKPKDFWTFKAEQESRLEFKRKLASKKTEKIQFFEDEKNGSELDKLPQSQSHVPDMPSNPCYQPWDSENSIWMVETKKLDSLGSLLMCEMESYLTKMENKCLRFVSCFPVFHSWNIFLFSYRWLRLRVITFIF